MHTTRALARELGVLDLVDARAYDRVVTLDGTKVVLDTGWWFGVRASGTEPVVRPYVETFAAPGAPAAARAEAAAWQRRMMAWLTAEIAAIV